MALSVRSGPGGAPGIHATRHIKDVDHGTDDDISFYFEVVHAHLVRRVVSHQFKMMGQVWLASFLLQLCLCPPHSGSSAPACLG